MVDLVQSQEARWSVIVVANAAAVVPTSGVCNVWTIIPCWYKVYSNVCYIFIPGSASEHFEPDAVYHPRAAEQKRARSRKYVRKLYHVAQSYLCTRPQQYIVYEYGMMYKALRSAGGIRRPLRLLRKEK